MRLDVSSEYVEAPNRKYCSTAEFGVFILTPFLPYGVSRPTKRLPAEQLELDSTLFFATLLETQ